MPSISTSISDLEVHISLELNGEKEGLHGCHQLQITIIVKRFGERVSERYRIDSHLSRPSVMDG